MEKLHKRALGSGAAPGPLPRYCRWARWPDRADGPDLVLRNFANEIIFQSRESIHVNGYAD